MTSQWQESRVGVGGSGLEADIAHRRIRCAANSSYPIPAFNRQHQLYSLLDDDDDDDDDDNDGSSGDIEALPTPALWRLNGKGSPGLTPRRLNGDKNAEISRYQISFSGSNIVSRQLSQALPRCERQRHPL